MKLGRHLLLLPISNHWPPFFQPRGTTFDIWFGPIRKTRWVNRELLLLRIIVAQFKSRKSNHCVTKFPFNFTFLNLVLSQCSGCTFTSMFRCFYYDRTQTLSTLTPDEEEYRKWIYRNNTLSLQKISLSLLFMRMLLVFRVSLTEARWYWSGRVPHPMYNPLQLLFLFADSS